MDITLYEFLKFAHITFAAVWIGTDTAMQVLSFRSLKAGGQRLVDFMSDVEWLGTRLLIPSSLLVVVFGVWMVLDNEVWDFSQTWITIGFAVFAASFLAGAGFLGPETGRLAKLTDEKGADDPEVRRRIKRILLVSRIELVLLVLVVLDMVVKPGFP